LKSILKFLFYKFKKLTQTLDIKRFASVFVGCYKMISSCKRLRFVFFGDGIAVHDFVIGNFDKERIADDTCLNDLWAGIEFSPDINSPVIPEDIGGLN